jgi:hypothetical protein
MRKHNNYVEAITTDTPTLMCVKMRPFSIGHYLLMKKYDCAYVSDDPKPYTIEDLIMSIMICSREFDDFLNFIDDKSCMKWIKKWGKFVNKEVKGNVNYLTEKNKQFIDYINDGIRIPKYWMAQNNESPRKSNRLIEHMITTLQGKLGYTRNEVLNCSLNQALYDYFLYLETNGVLELMNDEELDLLEEKLDV